MFLAEALMARSDLRARIEQVRVALRKSCRWQDGAEPEESAVDLLARLRGLESELGSLVCAVARTNGSAVLPGPEGWVLAEALVVREGLSARRKTLVAAADASSGPASEWESVWSEEDGRSRRVRVEWRSGLDARALRAEADLVSAEFRALDVRLQAANWSTPLA